MSLWHRLERRHLTRKPISFDGMYRREGYRQNLADCATTPLTHKIHIIRLFPIGSLVRLRLVRAVNERGDRIASWGDAFS